MVRIISILFFLFLFISSESIAQRSIRLMFYNTENLFDTFDDPKTEDNEFTPEGNFHWTNKKYKQKLQNIYKVVAAVGQWSPPEIICFCEVENRMVLNDLISKTPLSRFKFNIVHSDSPDPRGIDVALIYRSDKLKILQETNIPVIFPEKYKNHKTRNILLAKFSENESNSFFVFVNHWPSRRSGEMETDFFRLHVAKTLKIQIDSIFSTDKNAKIILVGDFNDEPTDESLRMGVGASLIVDNAKPGNLYNLSSNFLKDQKTGTIRFQGQWLVFDQIIVSGALLNQHSNISTTPANAKVFAQPFILQADKRNLGFAPFRTFSGQKYIGGYSDHLPVYLDLFIKN